MFGKDVLIKPQQTTEGVLSMKTGQTHMVKFAVPRTAHCGGSGCGGG